MLDDIDVGVAFMFFWGAFMFVGFVIVVSILRAIFDQYVKINKKENDDEDYDARIRM